MGLLALLNTGEIDDVLIDIEDHDLDFVAQVDDLRMGERSCWSNPFLKREPDLQRLLRSLRSSRSQ